MVLESAPDVEDDHQELFETESAGCQSPWLADRNHPGRDLPSIDSRTVTPKAGL